MAVSGRATPFILALFAWQGSVYATSPYMSWLNQHSVLPTELERRRATELTRERRAPYRRYYIGLAVSAIIAAIVAAFLLLGGSNPGAPKNPFHVTHRSGTDRGPIGNLFGPGVNKSTSVGGVVETTWTVRLKPGKYTFVCDAHAQMRGTFRVTA